MKKIVLSSLVIISFVLYSLHQRTEKEDVVPIVAPKNPSAPTSTSVLQNPTMSSQKPVGTYKDGSYTGDVVDAFYGNIQVQATITNGKITDIKFLQYPNDRDTSVTINQQSNPILAQEAIQAQSAQVDIVSGATDSSQAFIKSLQSALDQAKI